MLGLLVDSTVGLAALTVARREVAETSLVLEQAATVRMRRIGLVAAMERHGREQESADPQQTMRVPARTTAVRAAVQQALRARQRLAPPEAAVDTSRVADTLAAVVAMPAAEVVMPVVVAGITDGS